MAVTGVIECVEYVKICWVQYTNLGTCGRICVDPRQALIVLYKWAVLTTVIVGHIDQLTRATNTIAGA